MRRMLRAAIPALAATVLLHAGVRAARAGAVWVRAPEAQRGAGQLVADGAPLRIARGGDLAPLSGARRAVVFVFAPDCAASDGNMANWADLVRDARGTGLRFFAVVPEERPGAAAYWGALARHAPVLAPPAAEIQAVLGVDGTPATVLLEDGRVVGRAMGVLTEDSRAALRAFAAVR